WAHRYGLYLPDKTTLYPAGDLPIARAMRGETVEQAPIFIRHAALPEGRWLSTGAKPLRDQNGSVFGAIATFRDVSETRRTQETLQRTRDWSAAVVDTIGSLVVVLDRNGRIVSFNRECEKLTGYSFEEVRNRVFWEIFLVPEERDAVIAVFNELRSGSFPNKYENFWVTRDGSRRLIDWSNTALVDDHGAVEYIIATGIDVTERRRAEEELREASETLRIILQASPLAVWAIDTEGIVKFWNPAAERLYGWTEQEVLNQTLPVIPDDDRRDHLNMLEQARSGQNLVGVERRRKRKDGSVIEVSASLAPVRDSAGEITGYIGLVADFTDRKQLEEQLRQSQKMEAVGRLAGGVAHDFNNLLTVITGYGQMLLSTCDSSDPRRGDLEEILKAADSAAGLTNQLLAFSRRQVVQPKIIDLNDLVRNMDKMLHRVIGEDIELTMLLRPGLPKIKVDEGRMQQVLMNLVVNARDAMPRGGKVTIESAQLQLDADYARTHFGVKPGSYIMLAVSDSGTGMDEETRRHLFEPFFTTKGKGKGTGLGLSTVYGIVKQSGGNIWVYTEPGKGTTFKIYLPVVDGGTDAALADAARPELRRGTETILVAEDEPGLSKLIHQVLEQNGYTVLEAESSADALRLCEERTGPIHLLLTDVVMPQMSGRELAGAVSAICPDTRVLYMSGYTDNVIVHHGVLEKGVPFLQKPFTPDMLAAKVREVLDAKE
ncbi:MAG: PAS domain S-box protein, partial [Chloroflexi bacterium]|nr:PAS domain S-box protein [Chloroflexota bacterium]